MLELRDAFAEGTLYSSSPIETAKALQLRPRGRSPPSATDARGATGRWFSEAGPERVPEPASPALARRRRPSGRACPSTASSA